MYEEYFGFDKKPFRARTGRGVFIGAQQSRILAGLGRALSANDAVITVTGPAGVGKTTIVDHALANGPEHRVVARIGRMPLRPDDILDVILAQLDIDAPATGTIQRFAAFRHQLDEWARAGTALTIVVEDAVRAGNDALCELESLTAADNSETGGASIILMGPPDLNDKFMSPALARLRQRIRLRQSIQPLTANEAGQYLEQTIRDAGGDFDALFDDGAVELLHRCSEGYPRVIRNLGEEVLAAAAEAKANSISPQLIRQVASDQFGIDTSDAAAPAPKLAGTPVSASRTTAAADADEPVEARPEPPEAAAEAVVQAVAEPAAEAAPEDAGESAEAIPEAAANPPITVVASEPDDESIPDLIQDTLPPIAALTEPLPEPALDESGADLEISLTPDETARMAALSVAADDVAPASPPAPTASAEAADPGEPVSAAPPLLDTVETAEPPATEEAATSEDTAEPAVAAVPVAAVTPVAEPVRDAFISIEPRAPEPLSMHSMNTDGPPDTALDDALQPDTQFLRALGETPPIEEDAPVPLGLQNNLPREPAAPRAFADAPSAAEDLPTLSDSMRIESPRPSSLAITLDRAATRTPLSGQPGKKMPNIDALEAALAVARKGPIELDAPQEPRQAAMPARRAQPLAAQKLPEPPPVATSDIPEITLDKSIDERRKAAEAELKAPKAANAGQPDGEAAKKKEADDRAKLDRLAAELGTAKSLEEIDDIAAETLFGEEFNQAAAAVAAMVAANQDAADEDMAPRNTEVATGQPEPVAVAAGSVADGPGPAPAARRTQPPTPTLDESASRRLEMVMALNGRKPLVPNGPPEEIVLGSSEGPRRGPQPEPIENQFGLSMTQTLKALSASSMIAESPAEEKAARGGFLSRFRRS